MPRRRAPTTTPMMEKRLGVRVPLLRWRSLSSSRTHPPTGPRSNPHLPRDTVTVVTRHSSETKISSTTLCFPSNTSPSADIERLGTEGPCGDSSLQPLANALRPPAGSGALVFLAGEIGSPHSPQVPYSPSLTGRVPPTDGSHGAAAARAWRPVAVCS